MTLIQKGDQPTVASLSNNKYSLRYNGKQCGKTQNNKTPAIPCNASIDCYCRYGN